MKRMAVLMGVVMVMGLASLSIAGTTDSIYLRVTPVSNVSVNIVQTAYNYGTVDLYNATTVNTTAIEVKNDGSVNANWKHKADLQATGTVNWTLVYAGVAASTNEFRLWADIADTQPGSFADDAAHRVTTTNSNLSNGSNIAPNPDTGKNLWIKLEMPWKAGDSSEHTATYTITAEAVP